MARRNYDFAVIGGGLSGWLMARALSDLSNYNIALVEGGLERGRHFLRKGRIAMGTGGESQRNGTGEQRGGCNSSERVHRSLD